VGSDAQYVVTISISVFFIAYLSVFWSRCGSRRGHRRRGDDRGAARRAQFRRHPRVDARERRVAVVDFGTQLFLVLLGAALIFKPVHADDNVHWALRRLGQLPARDPDRHDRYTGWTISNLRRRRATQRDVRALQARRRAVFSIYLTAGDRAHGGCGVPRERRYTDALGQGRRTVRERPGARRRLEPGTSGSAHGVRSTSACWRRTILLIAANAASIGSSP
jgi:hypothetical protein